MKTENDKPNRRTIEALLNDLHRVSEPYYSEYMRLSNECDKLIDEFKKNARYRKLESQREAASNRWRSELAKIHDEVRRVRRLYQARGIVPSVLKAIEKLVEKVNKAK